MRAMVRGVSKMQVLVTGAEGFVGQNLCIALAEQGHSVLPFTRATPAAQLVELVARCDAIAHLAGANRPPSPEGFALDNGGLALSLAEAVLSVGRKIPIVFTSSTQAAFDNPYGVSKLAGEVALQRLSDVADIAIFRLPNVFGKWARPFYNSAVATFCHQAARGLPLSINDPDAALTLVYVDDVVAALVRALEEPKPGLSWPNVLPAYQTTVGSIAETIRHLAEARTALGVGETGSGLGRALYATLLSHLPVDSFSYPIPVYGDARGMFAEAIKTPLSGQVSFFTQVPGVERGGHYHHSKSEKFLVVKGKACFRFRHLITGERVDVQADAAAPRIVDTIPGWTHDVQNLADEELVVLVWANEVFDRQNSDTFISRVES